MKNRIFIGSLLVGMLACYVAVMAHADPRSPLGNDSLRSVIDIAVPTYNSAPAFTSTEQRCVQRMVFGEARNQAYSVQVAVAASVVNRSLSGTYPTDLCAVVAQSGQYKGYQRSITLPNDAEQVAWNTAANATSAALEGYGSLPADYRKSLYFHEVNLADWSRQYKPLGRLGNLIFYGSRSA